MKLTWITRKRTLEKLIVKAKVDFFLFNLSNRRISILSLAFIYHPTEKSYPAVEGENIILLLYLSKDSIGLKTILDLGCTYTGHMHIPMAIYDAHIFTKFGLHYFQHLLQNHPLKFCFEKSPKVDQTPHTPRTT